MPNLEIGSSGEVKWLQLISKQIIQLTGTMSAISGGGGGGNFVTTDTTQTITSKKDFSIASGPSATFTSSSGNGINVIATTGSGIYSTSVDGPAIEGFSTNDPGIFGYSFNSAGVFAHSANSIALIIDSLNGANTNHLADFRYNGVSKANIDYQGNLLATGYKTPGGLATQFLKADGSVSTTTTLGANLFNFTDPDAETFIRINADNTLSALDAATFRTAIGAISSNIITSIFGRTGAVIATNSDYTTALVPDTTNKRYQTDNQNTFNDATSSIQTQLNNKPSLTGTGAFGTWTINISGNAASLSANLPVNRLDSGTNASASTYWRGDGVWSSPFISNSFMLDFPNTAGESSSDITVLLVGAIIGDVVTLGVPHLSVLSGTSYTAWVSAVNTVTVRFNNYSAGSKNPASGLFKVTIIK